jgi:RNA polymerase sigma-70 factor (ECF subfamily)
MQRGGNKMAPNERITLLFNQYADSLLRLCFLYLKDRQLAEDAVQETFMSAYKNLGSFKSLSSEKTWLTRIAINVCKNLMRSKSYHEPAIELSELIPDKSNEYGQREISITVSGEIAKLPAKYREVILLFYYSELKTSEIAKLLRIPRTTVDYRLRQAKALLKQTLKEEIFYE